jgi:hypothetical protein
MPTTTPGFLAFATASLLASLALPSGASIVVGQTDDFENGTLLGWDSGSRNPNGPTNVPSGGPAGANDHFLHLTSNGSFGAGGKLVVFNADQWTGDYLGAGVTAIRMQVNNLGATNLALRLILEGGAGSLTTVSAASVPAGSGWETVSFSLASANLTGGNFNAVMGHVSTLDLVHNPSATAFRSSAPNIAAVLGVDNITAVPEPSALLLTVIGLAALVCRAGGKRSAGA